MSADILAFFPCDVHLGRALCDHLFASQSSRKIDALMLSKQSGIQRLVQRYPFRKIHCVDEGFYGRISSKSSMSRYERICCENFEEAVFPFNDFKANGFLLGSCAARRATAINVTWPAPEESAIRCMGRGCEISVAPPTYAPAAWDSSTLNTVRRTLAQKFNDPSDCPALHAGERPTSGLVQGYPYDLEVFTRYLSAGQLCKGGKVLDLGAGLGYGAFVLAQTAGSVVGIEADDASVAFSRQAWSPGASNLDFRQGDASLIDEPDATFDVVTCFEVLEHTERPLDILREASRALKPNGRLVFSTPDPGLFPYRVRRSPSAGKTPDELREAGVWTWHVSEISPRESANLCLEAGFAAPLLVYPTFTAGSRYWGQILGASELRTALKVLDRSTRWQLADFSLTAEHSSFFSGYSYVGIACKQNGTATPKTD